MDRLDLDKRLRVILGTGNVYFQPPASVEMKYPAIVYKRSTIDNIHANNRVYGTSTGYEVTVIDRDPDSEIVQKMSQLPRCKFVRPYTVDNLNHDVFVIY